VPIGLGAAAAHAPRGGIRPRDRYRFAVLAIDRHTGKTVWERTAREEQPHEATHQDNGTYASSSAITDGQRVYAWFESQGMYVYDMDGTLLWSKDLATSGLRNQFGEGSTPVLAGDRLVIVWDQQGGQSFIVSLDALSGREIWRVNRDEIDTWATPLVVEHDGRRQVIATGMKKIKSYDLDSGAVVWESKGVTMNPIPSPVFGDGMVFVTSGFQGNHLKAIRLANAKGDITGTDAIVWTLDRDTPYVPSPRSTTASSTCSRRTQASCPRSTPAPASRIISFSVLTVCPRCSPRRWRERARVHRRPRRHRDRHPQRKDIRGAREEQAERRVRCVAGAGGQRDLPARLSEPVHASPRTRPD